MSKKQKKEGSSLSVPFNIFDVESMEAEMEVSSPSVPSYTVLSWGRSDLGGLLRTNEGDLDGFGEVTFQGERHIIQVASNAYHTAAISATGDLYMCGTNDEGQVNPVKDSNGSLVQFYPKPKLFDAIGNHRVSRVSCGLYHTVCITATGVAISFGGNETGQLGHSPNTHFCAGPKAVEVVWRGKGTIFHEVACGDLFTLLLTTSGEIYSCGIGSNTGQPKQMNSSSALRIDSLVGVNITNIVCGSSHSFALSATRELYAWGSNQHGQLSIANADHVQVPEQVMLSPHFGNVRGICAGSIHSIFWSEDGYVYGCGSNKHGQVGTMSPRESFFESILLPWGKCIMAATGSDHTLAICEHEGEYRLYGWGSNMFGQVMAGNTTSLFRTPIEIADITNKFKIQQLIYIASGGDHSFAIGLRDAKSEDISSLLKKQFSTQASRAALAMNVDSLMHLVNKVSVSTSSSSSSNAIEMKELLGTVSQLFSSPSLLAGCFIDPNGPQFLDVNGLERFFKAFLNLGSNSVVRLLGAMSDCLNDMDSGEVISHESIVRLLLIIWQCPLFGNAILSTDVFSKVINIIFNMADRNRELLFKTIMNYPTHILAARLIRPCQDHLTWLVESNDSSGANSGNGSSKQTLIPVICDILGSLYGRNLTINKLPKEVFYNSGLSSLPEEVLFKDYAAWKFHQFGSDHSSHIPFSRHPGVFFISSFPFLLSPDAKKRLILTTAMYHQAAAQEQALEIGRRTKKDVYIFYVIEVNREHLVEDTLRRISNTSDEELKKPLKVRFVEEDGIDEGGVKKEFFQLLMGQLFSEDFGLFVPTVDRRCIWMNPNSAWLTAEYNLTGVLLGLALYNGVLLDIHFPMVFFKKLLNQPVTLDDLASFDPLLYKGLKQLLEFEPIEDIEQVFCRTFEVEWDEYGKTKKHELIPNGSNIAVTGLNRDLYVDRIVTWYLQEHIRPQFDALRTGFSRIMPPSSLLLLLPEELELLMGGMPHLDFRELEAHTQYISGDPSITWDASHPVIKSFWKLVHSMEFEEKQKLLLFITGSSKAPITGLKDLGLKIQRMCGDTDSLPTSYTCFNILMLPDYSSEEKLKDRLFKAINECEGFGLK